MAIVEVPAVVEAVDDVRESGVEGLRVVAVAVAHAALQARVRLQLAGAELLRCEPAQRDQIARAWLWTGHADACVGGALIHDVLVAAGLEVPVAALDGDRAGAVEVLLEQKIGGEAHEVVVELAVSV